MDMFEALRNLKEYPIAVALIVMAILFLRYMKCKDKGVSADFVRKDQMIEQLVTNHLSGAAERETKMTSAFDGAMNELRNVAKIMENVGETMRAVEPLLRELNGHRRTG